MTTPLSDYIKVTHGYAFPGEDFTEEPTGDLLLTPGNFAIGGGFQMGKGKYFKGDVPPEYVLPPGELVVTMTDLSKQSDTLGYPAIVPSLPGMRVLHNQRIGRIVFKTDNAISKRFLYYVMCTQGYRHEVLASATGTGVKHTAPTRIEAYKFDFPPLPVQRAIASVLGSLDDKIEQNRRTARALERLARAIFRAWFVDFEPVKAKAAGAAAFPSMPQAVFDALPTTFAESELGPVPEGWSTEPLSSIGRFLNGLALQKFPPTGDGSDLPVIKIAELRKGSSANADLANASIPPEYIIDDGDLVFSWSGTLEAVFWFGGRGALNQHLFKVTSADYPLWWCLRWIEQHLPWFRTIASSKATTMGHIKRGHLDEAKVAVPGDPVLHAADELMDPLVQQYSNLQIESRRLAALRDYLLPQLLSGQVPVEVGDA